MSSSRPFLVALVSLLVAGCGSSEAAKSPAGPKCDGDAGSGVCVTSVKGSLSDETGASVTGAPVSVCGAVCYSGQTDDTGSFDVAIGTYIAPSDFHVLLHARPLRAGFYYPLTGDPTKGVIDVGNLVALTLPTDGPALAVSGAGAPAQTLTSGDVTLSVPDGVDVRLDVEDAVLGATGKELRALTVPANERDKFVDPALGALAAYALGPFEATFDEKGTHTLTKAGLAFTNSTGLAAGTAVEVLAMGSYYVPGNLAPGAFGPVATGHVSADGKSVDLDAGEGIQYLTWFAIRAKK